MDDSADFVSNLPHDMRRFIDDTSTSTSTTNITISRTSNDNNKAQYEDDSM